MVVKYSTSAVPNTIKTNNIVFGISDADYGPTSSTGFWNGIDPPSSGYTIYTLTESRPEPSILVANNDNECVSIAKSFGGINVNTINEGINHLLSGSTNTTIVNINYPNIITNGLILHVDPGFLPSYPRNGTYVRDLNHTTGWNFGGSTVSFDASTQSFAFSNDSNAKWIQSSQSFQLTSPTSGLTYDFWCYLVGTVGLPSLFYDTGQGANPFVWIYENGGYMCIQYSNGGIVAPIVGTTVKDVWRNIVITFQYGSASESHLCSYINGTNVVDSALGTLALFPTVMSYKQIGDYGSAPGHNWAGYIGPVKIYNRILSQNEVTQNYNMIKGRFGL
jgi:hypothetical protein